MLLRGGHCPVYLWYRREEKKTALVKYYVYRVTYLPVYQRILVTKILKILSTKKNTKHKAVSIYFLINVFSWFFLFEKPLQCSWYLSQLGQVSLLLALSWRGCVFLQETTALRDRHWKHSLARQAWDWTHTHTHTGEVFDFTWLLI